MLATIIRFTVGRNDAYVRRFSSEALNLQIVWVVPWLIIAGAATATQSGYLALMTFAYFDVVAIYAMVVGVIGAVKAWRGEVWRYPVNVRIVPGGS